MNLIEQSSGFTWKIISFFKRCSLRSLIGSQRKGTWGKMWYFLSFYRSEETEAYREGTCIG